MHRVVAFLAVLQLTSSDITSQQPSGSTLLETWRNSNGPTVDRWDAYAAVYERYMPKPADVAERIKLLEIGIMHGGSAYTWRQYYGSKLYYVGADIVTATKAFENPAEDLYIMTGSQLDPAFLTSICENHGPFDVIIDDGGHTAAMIRTTLQTMFPSDACLAPSYSLYIVEDTHTMMRGDDYAPGGAQSIYGLAGEAFWAQHYSWAKRKASRDERNPYGPGQTQHPIFKDRLIAMHTYDSMIVLERAQQQGLNRLVGGKSKANPYVQIRTGIPRNESTTLHGSGKHHHHG